MSKIPKAGHVWMDISRDCAETIFLITRAQKKRRLNNPQIYDDIQSWQVLVTRPDGSLYFDVYSDYIIDDWYTEEVAIMKRVV